MGVPTAIRVLTLPLALKTVTWDGLKRDFVTEQFRPPRLPLPTYQWPSAGGIMAPRQSLLNHGMMLNVQPMWLGHVFAKTQPSTSARIGRITCGVRRATTSQKWVQHGLMPGQWLVNVMMPLHQPHRLRHLLPVLPLLHPAANLAANHLSLPAANPLLNQAANRVLALLN